MVGATPLIMRTKSLVAAFDGPAALLAVILSVKRPTTDGVPEIEPSSENSRPSGMSPDTVQVIGAVPSAESSALYGTSTVAAGRFAVMIVGAIAVDASITSLNVFRAEPESFVAITAND